MTEDPHFSFVVAAYALGFLIVAGMVFTILRDYFTLKTALSHFADRAARQEARRTGAQRESLD
ncbi:MAG: heme exporter protein CcmD [Methylocella sp.]